MRDRSSDLGEEGGQPLGGQIACFDFNLYQHVSEVKPHPGTLMFDLFLDRQDFCGHFVL